MKEAPPAEHKVKPPSAAQIRKELEELKPVAAARQIRIRDLEMKLQKARTLLKSDGPVGGSIQSDHYRLYNIIKDLRKLLDIKEQDISVE